MASGRGKVIVAMSGGVDSSVAACLLHEQGYEVTGLFMRTGAAEPAGEAEARPRGCCSALDATDARAVAGRLGIPFFVMNFKDQFDWLIDYFTDEYARGRTPNPCILCNERLKFGRLWEYAQAAQADFIATGHYARIDWHNGQHRLLRAVDEKKDQSYVLFGIGREKLPQTLFPLGDLYKHQVRQHARRFGLAVSAKLDSQDICFVPDRDYARVVRQRRPEAFREGPIVDGTGRELGRHGGIPNFTIGQRRGLGLAAGHPLYVTHLDSGANTVTVGTRSELASEALEASAVRWLVEAPAQPLRAAIKIRYTHEPAPAVVQPLGQDRVRVRFDQPQDAITPGQAAVFYDGLVTLGGGWID